ncbi:MAG: methyl-accepting chemotaxis protein [Actinomycetaceae bacterium]|nr:methyl-accepting chemotaxis protein [Actinomycetaceae bacterium]
MADIGARMSEAENTQNAIIHTVVKASHLIQEAYSAPPAQHDPQIAAAEDAVREVSAAIESGKNALPNLPASLHAPATELLDKVSELSTAQSSALSALKDSSPQVRGLMAYLNEITNTEVASSAEYLNAVKDGVSSDADALFETASATLVTALGVGLILITVSIILLLIVSIRQGRSLKRSTLELHSSLTQVADGDLTSRARHLSTDEVGHLSVKLNQSLVQLSQLVQSAADLANFVATDSQRLASSTGDLSAQAQGAATQISAVTQVTDRVSDNIRVVANNSTQMSESIATTAQEADQVARIAQKATQTAQRTTEMVSALGQASEEIGNMVTTIDEIAEQTNLLALNATIEAARAGDAGKGFAVVAGEVKDLASQTGNATSSISQSIATIQSDTQAAVEAIEEISEIIAQINELENNIAAAVEEQNATAAEMGRSVENAAHAADNVATKIRSIADVTATESTEIASIGNDMTQLVALSTALNDHMDGFTYRQEAQ